MSNQPQHWMHRKPHLIRRGYEANSAKLSAEDDEVIRAMHKNGMRMWQIAEHFNVSRYTIWRHLKKTHV